MDDTEEDGVNKFQLCILKHTPAWVVKEGDPHGTVARMILVILSFVPFFGLLAFVYAALTL